MLLTERQRTAEALAHSINTMGAWVVNPMPLRDDARLRFQVLDKDRDAILEKLSSWNWSPSFCGAAPRICGNGWKLASVYEIDLPRERMEVQDRAIRGELAAKQEPNREVEAILKEWYGRK